jgi:integrase
VLRRALVSAEEWGHVPHVPTVKWMRTDPPTFDFFTRDESERLLAATPREHLAIVATALKAGLRRGELLALEWQDIDLVTGKILVRRSVWRGRVTAPKSGKHREVAMSPQLARILKAHRHLKGRLVFSSADGSMLSKDMVKRILPAACRRAGLREIQWHVLRHSFASHLVMANVPLKAVQELLGHATIDVTMRYAHLAPGVHSDAVARLDAPAAHEEKVGQLLGNDGRVVP